MSINDEDMGMEEEAMSAYAKETDKECMAEDEMKEVIQLNLTKKELIILQAITATSVSAHLKDVVLFGRNMYRMEYYMSKWPEASYSLADKLTNSLEVTAEMLLTE